MNANFYPFQQIHKYYIKKGFTKKKNVNLIQSITNKKKIFILKLVP
jgi:hypothetical protein